MSRLIASHLGVWNCIVVWLYSSGEEQDGVRSSCRNMVTIVLLAAAKCTVRKY